MAPRRLSDRIVTLRVKQDEEVGGILTHIDTLSYGRKDISFIGP